jgi:hypothetical protein
MNAKRKSRKITPVSSTSMVHVGQGQRRDKIKFSRDNVVEFKAVVGELVYVPSNEELLLGLEMAYDYLNDRLSVQPEAEEPKAEEPKASGNRSIKVKCDGIEFASVTEAMRHCGYFKGTAYTQRDVSNHQKISRNIKKGPYVWDNHTWEMI